MPGRQRDDTDIERLGARVIEDDGETFSDAGRERTGRRWRPASTDREADQADRRRPEDAEIERIGRRRRIRPEHVVLIGAVIFVVGALAKPWAGPTPPNPAPNASLVANATASPGQLGPTPAPSSTINVYGLIPPYNYRPGQWPPGQQLVTPAPDPAWMTTDWSFLRELDTHTKWGVSAMTLPTRPGDAAAAPQVSWVDEVAPWSPSVVYVPTDSSVFAIAITWPSGIRVDSISFDYLSFESPRAGVTPVSAAVVATPAPGAPADEKPSATASRSPSARPTLDPKAGTMVSGAFWIAPSSDLGKPIARGVQTIWQITPWVWPLGSYRVRLETNAGEMLVALQLERF